MPLAEQGVAQYDFAAFTQAQYTSLGALIQSLDIPKE